MISVGFAAEFSKGHGLTALPTNVHRLTGIIARSTLNERSNSRRLGRLANAPTSTFVRAFSCNEIDDKTGRLANAPTGTEVSWHWFRLTVWSDEIPSSHPAAIDAIGFEFRYRICSPVYGATSAPVTLTRLLFTRLTRVTSLAFVSPVMSGRSGKVVRPSEKQETMPFPKYEHPRALGIDTAAAASQTRARALRVNGDDFVCRQLFVMRE
jgi:hypothetical protein